ncbi:MAG: flagellar basal-body rod protein FlgG [Pseudomonadota bacterium]|jgi:flagellar basal-body rod protein FlgG
MMRALWISKTGMEAQQTQLDVVSHNLANVATHGYKKSRAVFEDLMYQTLRQGGAPAADASTLPVGSQVGLGVRTAATARDFGQGNLQQTGQSLDLAVKGAGFFVVQMPDGSTAYTRDGGFQLGPGGQVVTANGQPLQPGLTVPANAQSITVAADGTVSVTVPGQAAPQAVGQVTLANFANPAGLEPRGQNLFTETAASGTPSSAAPGSDGLGTLAQGFVETSNVNVVEELVAMIQTQRAYELNSKAIATADQMLQRLGQL